MRQFVLPTNRTDCKLSKFSVHSVHRRYIMQKVCKMRHNGQNEFVKTSSFHFLDLPISDLAYSAYLQINYTTATFNVNFFAALLSRVFLNFFAFAQVESLCAANELFCRNGSGKFQTRRNRTKFKRTPRGKSLLKLKFFGELKCRLFTTRNNKHSTQASATSRPLRFPKRKPFRRFPF